MTTYNIATNLDDGDEIFSTWAANGDNAGAVTLGTYGGGQYYSAFRFQVNETTLDANTSATLRLYTLGTMTSAPIVHLHADASDDSAQPSSSNLPSSLTLTTAVLDVDGDSSWGVAGNWIEFDVKAIVQEILGRAGWSSGNHITFIFVGDNNAGGNSHALFSDYSTGNAAELLISSPMAITGFNNADYEDGSSGNEFTFNNSADTITSVDLIRNGITSTQQIDSQTSTLISLTCVQGDVPYGSDAVLRFNYSGGYLDYTVNNTPPSGYGAVIADVSGGTPDETSLFYGVSPAVQTGDTLEWQDATNFTCYSDGTWERASGSSATSLIYRVWLQADQAYTNWATITVSTVPTANIQDVLIRDLIQAPTVTGHQLISDLSGLIIGAGTLIGDMPLTKKIIIDYLTPVVDIYGSPVDHVYDHWFITQSNIDMASFNGTAINVVDSGNSLSVVAGTTEVTIPNATTGQTYTLVAFDEDGSNYFRFSGTVVTTV